MYPPCATATGAPASDPVPRRHRRWYRGAIVRGGRRVFGVARSRIRGAIPQAPRTLALAAATGSVLLACGCGGGSRQDVGEVAGTFEMKLLHASFPSTQAVARPTRLELQVRNTGAHTVPNVAVTVDSFNYTSNAPELAADKRPVWAIERGPGAIAQPPVETQEVSVPGGGQTAYLNTWALGPLAPGRTQTFIWRVVPVKAGTHTVRFAVSAGLAGKAKARLASGAAVRGQFKVDIAAAPPRTHVDPATGRVVAGSFSATP